MYLLFHVEFIKRWSGEEKKDMITIEYKNNIYGKKTTCPCHSSTLVCKYCIGPCPISNDDSLICVGLYVCVYVYNLIVFTHIVNHSNNIGVLSLMQM